MKFCSVIPGVLEARGVGHSAGEARQEDVSVDSLHPLLQSSSASYECMT